MSAGELLERVLLPDVQRDGYHSVEDDDVGPEGEEAGENGVPLNRVPGQIFLEVYSNQALPNGVSNGQNSSHKDKEGKDLAYRSLFYCIQIQKIVFSCASGSQGRFYRGDGVLPYMMLLSFVAVGIILLFARPETVILICFNR